MLIISWRRSTTSLHRTAFTTQIHENGEGTAGNQNIWTVLPKLAFCHTKSLVVYDIFDLPIADEVTEKDPKTMNTALTSSGSGWSDLPEDLLQQILARLPAPDRFSCTRVCRSWRKVRRLYRPPPLIRVVKCPVADDHYKARGWYACRFALRSADACFTKLSRVFVFPNPIQSVPCVGYNAGAWLAVASAHPRRSLPKSIHLVNPMSGKQINLPLTSTTTDKNIIAVALSAPPLTVKNCTVILVGRNMLASCKLGDREWAEFEDSQSSDFADIAGMALFNCELHLLSASGRMAIYALDPPRPRRVEMLPCSITRGASTNMRLFESRGVLFLVRRSYGGCGASQFVVFRRRKNGSWARVASMGDRAICVVGEYGAGCVYAAGEFMGMDLRRDWVYESYEHSDQHCHNDGLCIYSLECGRFKILCHFQGEERAQGWISPSERC